MTFAHTRFLIAEDLRQRACRSGKSYTWFSYVKLGFDPPALAVTIFRVQAWLQAQGFTRLATTLRFFNIVAFSIDIGSRAQIGAGLIIYHPSCVVICDQCVAGKNLHLVHHNTVAIGPRESAHRATDRVRIGDNVVLGCGSRIVGALTLGNHCFVGANAVVTTDAAAGSFLVEPDFTFTG